MAQVSLSKRATAEFIGTFWLVFGGWRERSANRGRSDLPGSSEFVDADTLVEADCAYADQGLRFRIRLIKGVALCFGRGDARART